MSTDMVTIIKANFCYFLYLGPRRNFEDEYLEYLSKDDFEDQLRLLHHTPPASRHDKQWEPAKIVRRHF